MVHLETDLDFIGKTVGSGQQHVPAILILASIWRFDGGGWRLTGSILTIQTVCMVDF